MLDNDKLNKRLKKIFKELKDKWGLTSYRVSVETGVPHSSLKYMKDGKFEWKLNHLLAVIDFLNRYGTKISLKDLLDFSEKKSMAQILNMDNADFRIAVRNAKRGQAKKPDNKKKAITVSKPIDHKKEVDYLVSEITDILKENRLYKKSKIVVSLKLNGKDINFQKEIKF